MGAATLPVGWSRVRVAYAGLCGSDLHRLSGGASRPDMLGHEVSGIVEELNGEAGVQVGDRVAAIPLLWCGSCWLCQAGQSNICSQGEAIGRTHPGGFNRWVDVPAANCRLVPDSMPLDVAALADVVAVCVHALHVAGYRPGQSALVIGDGAVGLTLALLLAQWSSGVSVSGKHHDNLQLVRTLSAGRVNVLTAEATTRQFDQVFETVGRGRAETMRQAVEVVLPRGTVTVLGVYPSGYELPLAARDLFIKEGKLVGSNSYVASEFDEALDLMTELPGLGALITHRFPLEDFQAGVDCLSVKVGPTVKVQFLVGGESV